MTYKKNCQRQLCLVHLQTTCTIFANGQKKKKLFCKLSTLDTLQKQQYTTFSKTLIKARDVVNGLINYSQSVNLLDWKDWKRIVSYTCSPSSIQRKDNYLFSKLMDAVDSLLFNQRKDLCSKPILLICINHFFFFLKEDVSSPPTESGVYLFPTWLVKELIHSYRSLVILHTFRSHANSTGLYNHNLPIKRE